MQFSPARLGFALCLLLPACARPLLSELGEDDATDDAAVDAATNPQPSKDAGANDAQLVPDTAVACPDLDSDGHCDADDNCPSAKNPTQVDSDEDGKGDACDAVVPCEAEAVVTPVMGGAATLQNVTVNGEASPLTVAPDAPLEIRLNYSFGMCAFNSGSGFARTVTVGFEGESSGQCESLALNGLPCLAVNNQALDGPIRLRAPSSPGVHYIVGAGAETNVTCSPTLSDAARIAAICVQ